MSRTHGRYSMISLLAIVIGVFTICCFEGGLFVSARSCPTLREPISLVQFDEELGKYVVLKENIDVDDEIGIDDSTRNLAGVEEEGEEMIIIDVGERRLQATTNTNNDTLFVPPAVNNATNATFYPMRRVRRCPCNRFDDERELYCPLYAPVCFVPRWRSSKNFRCFNLTSARTQFLGWAWPLLWFWFLLITVGLFTSQFGRNTIMYCFSGVLWSLDCVCCNNRNKSSNNNNNNNDGEENEIAALGEEGEENEENTNRFSFLETFNQRRVEHMINHNPFRVNGFLRLYNRRNRDLNLGLPIVFPLDFNPVWNQTATRDEYGPNQQRPSHLALKTRIYQKPQNEGEQQEDHMSVNKSEGGDELMCSICFIEIDPGNRVGELHCGHLFHSDCLKTWLTRRNVCPLCQAPDVAQPKFLNPPSNNENNNNDEQEETNEDNNAIPGNISRSSSTFSSQQQVAQNAEIS